MPGIAEAEKGVLVDFLVEGDAHDPPRSPGDAAGDGDVTAPDLDTIFIAESGRDFDAKTSRGDFQDPSDLPLRAGDDIDGEQHLHTPMLSTFGAVAQRRPLIFPMLHR